MRKLVFAILISAVGLAAASDALAGNPNCPQPTLPGGIKPNNWSCPTGDNSPVKKNPAKGPTGPSKGRPPWPNWPEPYRSLSEAPPEACRPYLADWKTFEKCLLEKKYYPHDMPKLKSAKYEAWGRSNRGYNCYAYAVSPYDPSKTWFGPRMGEPARTSYREFVDFIEGIGWRRADVNTADRILNSTANPRNGEERVIIFRNPVGSPEHAALWDARGILAKMGEYGVFRFESLDQMAGPLYGRPAEVYTNNRK